MRAVNVCRRLPLVGLLALLVVLLPGPPASARSTTPAIPADRFVCRGDDGRSEPHLCPENRSPVSLGYGGAYDLDSLVVNRGAKVAQGARVVVELPAGLALDSSVDDPDGPSVVSWTPSEATIEDNLGRPLDCTAANDAHTITCTTGPLAAHANLFVRVTVAVEKGGPPTGSRAQLRETLQPIAPSTYPATTAVATVRYYGRARLSKTWSTTTATVPVGRTVTLTLVIHNAGPDPAVDTGATVVLGGACCGHFGIRSGSVRDRDDAGLVDSVEVSAGTIAVGSSVRIRVRVRAEKVGRSELDADAASLAGDPACPVGGCMSARVHLRAVAAGADGGTTSTGPGGLAATGTDRTRSWTFGLLCVLVGVGLCVSARRRPDRMR